MIPYEASYGSHVYYVHHLDLTYEAALIATKEVKKGVGIVHIICSSNEMYNGVYSIYGSEIKEHPVKAYGHTTYYVVPFDKLEKINAE